MKTKTGFRINKNGKPITTELNELPKTSFKGESFKQNGDYYYFKFKRNGLYIYTT